SPPEVGQDGPRDCQVGTKVLPGGTSNRPTGNGLWPRCRGTGLNSGRGRDPGADSGRSSDAQPVGLRVACPFHGGIGVWRRLPVRPVGHGPSTPPLAGSDGWYACVLAPKRRSPAPGRTAVRERFDAGAKRGALWSAAFVPGIAFLAGWPSRPPCSSSSVLPP